MTNITNDLIITTELHPSIHKIVQAYEANSKSKTSTSNEMSNALYSLCDTINNLNNQLGDEESAPEIEQLIKNIIEITPQIFNFDYLFKIQAVNNNRLITLSYSHSPVIPPIFLSLILMLLPNESYNALKKELDIHFKEINIDRNTYLDFIKEYNSAISDLKSSDKKFTKNTSTTIKNSLLKNNYQSLPLSIVFDFSSNKNNNLQNLNLQHFNQIHTKLNYLPNNLANQFFVENMDSAAHIFIDNIQHLKSTLRHIIDKTNTSIPDSFFNYIKGLKSQTDTIHIENTYSIPHLYYRYLLNLNLNDKNSYELKIQGLSYTVEQLLHQLQQEATNEGKNKITIEETIEASFLILNNLIKFNFNKLIENSPSLSVINDLIELITTNKTINTNPHLSSAINRFFLNFFKQINTQYQFDIISKTNIINNITNNGDLILSDIIESCYYLPFNGFFNEFLVKKNPELYHKIGDFLLSQFHYHQTTNLYKEVATYKNKKKTTLIQINENIVIKPTKILKFYEDNTQNKYTINTQKLQYLNLLADNFSQLTHLTIKSGMELFKKIENDFSLDQVFGLLNLYVNNMNLDKLYSESTNKTANHILTYIKTKTHSAKTQEEKDEINRKSPIILYKLFNESRFLSEPIFDPFNIFSQIGKEHLSNHSLLLLSPIQNLQWSIHSQTTTSNNLRAIYKPEPFNFLNLLKSNSNIKQYKELNTIYINLLNDFLTIKDETNQPINSILDTSTNENHHSNVILSKVLLNNTLNIYDNQKPIKLNNIPTQEIYELITTNQLSRSNYEKYASKNLDDIDQQELDSNAKYTYHLIQEGAIPLNYHNINNNNNNNNDNLNIHPLILITLYGSNLIDNMDRIYADLDSEQIDIFNASILSILSTNHKLQTNPNQNNQQGYTKIDERRKQYLLKIISQYDEYLLKEFNVYQVLYTKQDVATHQNTSNDINSKEFYSTITTSYGFSDALKQYQLNNKQPIQSLYLKRQTMDQKSIKLTNSRTPKVYECMKYYLAHIRISIQDMLRQIKFDYSDDNSEILEEVDAAIQCHQLQKSLNQNKNQIKNKYRI